MSFASIRRSTFLLVAMFSLAASSVAACACAHHKPAEAAENSGHGVSHRHETPATTADSAADTESFAPSCSCYSRMPVPAVVAKQDDKRYTTDAPPAERAAVVIDPVARFERSLLPVANFRDLRFFKSEDLLASLPARAPPRL